MSDDTATHLKTLRELNYPLYLARIFLSAEKQRPIIALDLFSQELWQIADRVKDPIAGEIRLQWWRECLVGARKDEARGHPVASLLLDEVSEEGLPVKGLKSAIDAHDFDLYDDPMPSLTDLEGYCGEVSSLFYQVAAGILLGDLDPATATAAGHAGVASGLTRLLHHYAEQGRGRAIFVPPEVFDVYGLKQQTIDQLEPEQIRALYHHMIDHALDHAQKAQDAVKEIDPRSRPAFLPLVADKLRLHKMKRLKDPMTERASLAPLSLYIRLFLASRRGF